jgi:acyl-CoA synthetase (NDP forming)
MRPEDIFSSVRNAGRRELSEEESRQVFEHFGIPVVEGVIVSTVKAAVDTAEKMGYPVVLKIASPDILHKTDVGGVKTAIYYPEDVEIEYETILKNTKLARPDARIDGIMIQPMEQRGLEVIVGGVQDAVFGSIVMFGLGGILTEVLRDVTFGLAPVTPEEAVEMIEGIQSRSLLHGYRGKLGIDIQALADIVEKVSHLMEHPEVAEVDANPLFAKSDGAVCVDARIILTEKPAPLPIEGHENSMTFIDREAEEETVSEAGEKARRTVSKVGDEDGRIVSKVGDNTGKAVGIVGDEAGRTVGMVGDKTGRKVSEVGNRAGRTVTEGIRNLFVPTSVVLIGSSAIRRKGRMASPELFASVRYNLETYFTGELTVFDVEEQKPEKLQSIPADTAVMALPSEESIAILPHLNVGSIIQIDGAFSPEMRSSYQEHLQRSGTRMLGPTTIMGVISPDIGFNTSFERDLMPKPGKIAVLSQSGGVGAILLDWAKYHGIGISRFAFMGEKLNVGDTELLTFLDSDPETKVICIYMEGVKDGRGFVELVKGIRKPILVLKGGTSEASKKRAASHTASMAGSDEVFNAAFHSAGVLRVNSIEELFSGAKALISQQPMKGRRVAVVSNVGGPAILAADALEKEGLKLATLTRKTRESLTRKIPEIFPTAESVINPIDTIADARAERFETILEDVLEDPEVDGVMVINMLKSTFFEAHEALAIANMVRKYNKPVVDVPAGGEDFLMVKQVLENSDLPAFDLPEKAAKVLRFLFEQHQALKKKNPI